MKLALVPNRQRYSLDEVIFVERGSKSPALVVPDDYRVAPMNRVW